MDTITHGLFGAAIGAAFPAAPHRRRAAALAAAAAMLPDADIFLRGILEHRAETHSFFYLAAAVPLLAATLGRWLRGWTFRRRCGLLFLALFSHPLLDLLNSYSTRVGLPFTEERAALDILPIVDPLFALPLLLSAALVFLRRNTRAAENAAQADKLSARAGKMALLWCFLYILAGAHCRNTAYDLTLAEAARAEAALTGTAAPENAPATVRVSPLTGTIFLWRGAAVYPGRHARVFYADALRRRVFYRSAPLTDYRGPEVEELLRTPEARDFQDFTGGAFVVAAAVRRHLSPGPDGKAAPERPGDVWLCDLRYGTLAAPDRPLFRLYFPAPDADGRRAGGQRVAGFRPGDAGIGRELSLLWRVLATGALPED